MARQREMEPPPLNSEAPEAVSHAAELSDKVDELERLRSADQALIESLRAQAEQRSLPSSNDDTDKVNSELRASAAANAQLEREVREKESRWQDELRWRSIAEAKVKDLEEQLSMQSSVSTIERLSGASHEEAAESVDSAGCDMGVAGEDNGEMFDVESVENVSPRHRAPSTTGFAETSLVRMLLISGKQLGPDSRKERFRDRWLDPYVVLQVVKSEMYIFKGPRGKTTKEGVRSTHCKSTNNPSWNETLLCAAEPIHQLVVIQAWDFSRFGQHECLGQAVIQREDLTSQEKEFTVMLEPNGGEISCTLQWLTQLEPNTYCLLYTSDAADEEDSVDLGGGRLLKNKICL
eukprot:TRINITY_DN5740_c0_g1_i3.p1 TRINITY_DN5740_c0_g1~~TRINITY_DN5740_c0_g1_i3.p1  ORF type:complete len:349 (+),score=78.70 TRINITY_DN5740_c0_g1_i3:931-1977(+)